LLFHIQGIDDRCTYIIFVIYIDYDLNKSDAFKVDDKRVSFPSTSKLTSSKSNGDSKYASMAACSKPTSSITLGNGNNRPFKRLERSYQQIVDYDEDDEEPTLRSKSTSSDFKRRRNFISDMLSVKMKHGSAVKSEKQDEICGSWEEEEPEEVDIEPCFTIEPKVEIIEDGQTNENGLNVSGDEWEIYNTDEEDLEGHNFNVIGNFI